VPRKISTSVTLDAEIIKYLDSVAKREERTRSQVITRIVREHAERNGQRILPKEESTSA